MSEKHFSFPHSPKKIAAFIVASIFFLFVAVILITSAKGYKIEFSKNGVSFKKTGTIIITSQPSGAKIYLNDKLYTKTTGSNIFTTKIASLFPGRYSVKVEKDGFITWQKNIEVKAEAVSWANYIVLFPKESKKESLLDSATLIEQTEDKKRIAVIDNSKNKNLFLIDSNNLAKSKLYTFENKNLEKGEVGIQSLKWSKNSSKLLAITKQGEEINYLILNANNPKEAPTNITDLFKLQFEKIEWNLADTEELIALKDKTLYKINVQNKTISASLSDNVISFSVGSDKNLYIVRSLNSEVTLWRLGPSETKITKIIKSLPLSKNYYIKPYDGKLLITVNGEVKTIYLADKIDGQLEMKQLTSDAINAYWSENGKRILLMNSTSLFVYDLEKEKTYTVTKDKKINYATWDEGNDRILANIEGQYLTLEFDGNNPIKIGDSKLDKIYFSEDNKHYIYVSSEKGDEGKLMVYKR